MAFKDEYKKAYVTPDKYETDQELYADDMNNIIAGIEECKETEDGKLDKINSNNNSIQAYVVSKKGNVQGALSVSTTPADTTIACYENENLNVGTPIKEAHAANKKYVDDAVAGIENSGGGLTEEQANIKYVHKDTSEVNIGLTTRKVYGILYSAKGDGTTNGIPNETLFEVTPTRQADKIPIYNGNGNLAIQTASDSVTGGVKIKNTTEGLAIWNDYLIIKRADPEQIDGKGNAYRPIVPQYLEYSVMKALSECKVTSWTNEQKIAACNLLKPSLEHIGTITIGQPVEEGSLLTAVEAEGTFEAIPSGKKYQEIMIYLTNFQSASNINVDTATFLNGGQNSTTCVLNSDTNEKTLHIMCRDYFMEVEACVMSTGRCERAMRFLENGYYAQNKIHSVQITQCPAGARIIVYGIPA